MSELEFKEYEGTGKDSEGNDVKSTVRAAEVTETTQVTGRGNSSQTANKGDFIVETDRPGVYDVHTGDAWQKTGYGDTSITSKDTEDDSDTDLL